MMPAQALSILAALAAVSAAAAAPAERQAFLGFEINVYVSNPVGTFDPDSHSHKLE